MILRTSAPHRYSVSVAWTGNHGSGTSAYKAYGREHTIAASGKATEIAGSATPSYRGDSSRYNPEELLVAALSACHMLWYLHLCAERGIAVLSYRDDAEGTMQVGPDGSGEFVDVLLRPSVHLADASATVEALRLHERAHAMCFIARSVKFPVRCAPTIA